MEPHLMSEARFHCYISLSALQTDCLSLQNYENKLDRSWYVNDFNKNVRKGVLFCPEVLKYKIVCFIISESVCLVTMGVRVITLLRTSDQTFYSDTSGILSTAFIIWGRADYQQPVGERSTGGLSATGPPTSVAGSRKRSASDCRSGGATPLRRPPAGQQPGRRRPPTIHYHLK